MLFTVECIDKPSSLSLRQETRDAHLEFLETLGGALRLAGPLLNAEGDSIGSLLFIEAGSFDEVHQLVNGDPYRAVGLFERTTITQLQLERGAL